MSSFRTLKKPLTWAGSLACLAISTRAWAGEFVLNTVLNDETAIGGGVTFHDADQVVAGNDGVVATIFGGSGDSGITFNAANGNGNTQIIARDASLAAGPTLNDYDSSSVDSFDIFSELSLSQTNQTRLTFLAQDTNSTFGLYRADISNTLATSAVQREGTFTLVTDPGGMTLAEIHQQVNAKGQVAYGRRLGADQQSFVRTEQNPGDGDFILDSGALKEFNYITPASPIYKRLAVAEDGSVVFRATRDSDGAIGIYRSTDLGNPIVPITSRGIVVGADNTHVLYTDEINSSTTALYLAGEPLLLGAPLVTYHTSPTDAGHPHNAVMTQGEHIAFFTPDNPSNLSDPTASVGYYRPGLSQAQFIAREGDPVSLGNQTFTIQQISTTGQRNSIPMVNDRGTVVFDANLTTSENTTVTALLVWRESTGVTQIVVKTADENGNFGDTYNGYVIDGLVVDAMTDQAGDVLKDGLSDDNWLAFGIQYQIGDEEHQAVVSVMLPEPTSVGLVTLGASSIILRRRRRAGFSAREN